MFLFHLDLSWFISIFPDLSQFSLTYPDFSWLSSKYWKRGILNFTRFIAKKSGKIEYFISIIGLSVLDLKTSRDLRDQICSPISILTRLVPIFVGILSPSDISHIVANRQCLKIALYCWGTAVKHTSRASKDMGLNPVGYWAFFFSYLSYQH